MGRRTAIVVLTILLIAMMPSHASSPRQDWNAFQQLVLAARASDLPANTQRRQLGALSRLITSDAPYQTKRELARGQIALAEGNDYSVRVAALRDLAQVNGDRDTADLMRVWLIYERHTDAEIESNLRALDQLRLQMAPDASVELREAMETSYGNMYWDVGSFELALRHLLRARDLLAKLPGTRPDDLVLRNNNIAWLQVDMDDPNAALAELALLASGASAGTTNPTTIGHLMVTRGAALRLLGRLPEARLELESAIARSALAQVGNEGLRARQELVEVLLLQQANREALRVSAEFMRMAAAHEVPYYIAEADVLHGVAMLRTGDEAAGLRSIQLGIRHFRERSHFVALHRALGHEVDALTRIGRPREALDALQQRLDLSMRLYRSNRTLSMASLEVEQQLANREKRILQLSGENRRQRERLEHQRLQQTVLSTGLVSAGVIMLLLGLLLRNVYRQKRQLSRDALTGAFNRHHYHAWLNSHPLQAGNSRALLLLDLDHFKTINDRHGHLKGDQVLQATVANLRGQIKDGGELFRWGGEEFLLVIDFPLSERVLPAMLSDMLAAVSAVRVQGSDGVICVSASIGCYRLPAGIPAPSALTRSIAWADAALYMAKAEGRQCAVLVSHSEEGIARLEGAMPNNPGELRTWIDAGWVIQRSVLAAAGNASNSAPMTATR